MSLNPTREQLQSLLGDCVSVPSPVSHGTQEVSVNASDFEKLLAYWKGMQASSRPRLRGLSVSRGKARMLQLLVSASGGGGASVIISAELGASFPPIHEAWPYAVWWEDELKCFEGVSVPDRREGGGVIWRRN